ncbi:5-formyltetrahydrofolate cyclo-ligase [Pendulispora albinea]|uniref:5-formyltetrahydrofolate cyclo-ligase n=1 Tax=Pendulispora albinea TaxID=2741071 RepID=A0ABZ2LUF7_9BACT
MKEPVSIPPGDPNFEQVVRRRVKAELRKRMRGLRATTPESACAARSSQIVARLREMPALREARSVALFWPIEARREVDLRSLDQELRAKNVRLFYPTIDGESLVMTFKLVPDVAQLAEAGFGFAEPASDAEAAREGELDAIVVPALAVDPAGYRIGYGKGYYDRTLPRFAPPAVTIAVAYDFQLISEVPITEGDVSVDWIVTDQRGWRAQNQQGAEAGAEGAPVARRRLSRGE